MRAPLILLMALAVSSPAAAQNAAHGKEVFDLWCYACHKPLNQGDKPVAGTSSLQRKYDGKIPAALEQRTDLSPAFIKAIVRTGTKSMPFSRKTEISDADLDDLAAYLSKRR